MLSPAIKTATALWMNSIYASAGQNRLIGFIQNEAGRGIHVTSNDPTYHSERQISSLIGNFDPRRISKIGECLDFKPEEFHLHRGKYFELLPKTFRSILESGRIVLFTNEQPRIPTPVSKLAMDPKTGKVTFQSKIKDSNEKHNYRLLHFSYEKNLNQGRTAILLDQNNQPVTVSIDGKEYCIELKGCGCSAGKIGEKTSRSGMDSVYGGLMCAQGLREFENLELNHANAACKSGALVTFNYKNQQLSYIVRLTPSTVRASYTLNGCFPNKEEAGIAISKAYAQLLVEQLTSSHPFLMDHSAHHENILITPERFYWTDYSDHLRLGSSELPYVVEGTLITHKTLLNQLFSGLSEVPHSSLPQFIAEFNQQAFTAGLEVRLGHTDDSNTCVNKIYSGLLAERVIKDRKINNFSYDKFIEDFISENSKHQISAEEWESLKSPALEKFRALKDLPPEITPEYLKNMIDALDGNRIKDFFDLVDRPDCIYTILPLAPEIREICLRLAQTRLKDLFSLIDSEADLLQGCTKSTEVTQLDNRLAITKKRLSRALNFGIKGLNQVLTNQEFLSSLFKQT